MVVAKIWPQWRMSFFLLLSTGFLSALWVSWVTTIWATQNHAKSTWVSCQKDPFQLGIWGGAAYQQANNILDHCSQAVKWRPPDHPIFRTDLIRRVIFLSSCVDQLPKWWRAVRNNVNLKASRRMKTSSKLCIERDTYTHPQKQSKTVSSVQNRILTLWCLQIADSLILSSHSRHYSPCTPTLARWSRENLSFCRVSRKNTTSSRVFKRTNHVHITYIYIQ